MLKRNHLALGLALAFVACVESEEPGKSSQNDERASAGAGRKQRAEALLGSDGAGHLLAVRVADGEVVARFAMGESNRRLDASAFVDSDGTLAHLALLARDGAEHTALAFVPVGEAGFQPVIEGPQVASRSRVLALPEGALVMHAEAGPRWSFAQLGGPIETAAACSLPASIIALRSSDETTHVEAFGWSQRLKPSLIDGTLEGGAWHCQERSIASEEPLSPSARVARVASIGNVIVDIGTTKLRVAALPELVAGPFAATPFYASSIEQVEPWAVDGRVGVVILSRNPNAVSVLSLRGETPTSLDILEAATVLLPDIAETSWLARQLVVTDDAVFVATESGVVGLELAVTPSLGLHPFELPHRLASLRGPLVALPRLPPSSP